MILNVYLFVYDESSIETLRQNTVYMTIEHYKLELGDSWKYYRTIAFWTDSTQVRRQSSSYLCSSSHEKILPA